jgi:hypothetical protein
MNLTKAAKRIGTAMIEVSVKDFVEGGFIAIFHGGKRRCSYQVGTNMILTIDFVAEVKTQILKFTIRNTQSGREETVSYLIPRTGFGEVSIEQDTSKPYALDYLWVATELAKAMVVLNNNITISGEIRELYQGGNGFSAIASEDVAEAFDGMRNKAVRSAAA